MREKLAAGQRLMQMWERGQAAGFACARACMRACVPGRACPAIALYWVRAGARMYVHCSDALHQSGAKRG